MVASCLEREACRQWPTDHGNQHTSTPSSSPSFVSLHTTPHASSRVYRQAGVPEPPQGFEQAAEVVADQEKPPQGGGGETEENHRTGGDLCRRMYATVRHRTPPYCRAPMAEAMGLF